MSPRVRKREITVYKQGDVIMSWLSWAKREIVAVHEDAQMYTCKGNFAVPFDKSHKVA